MTYACFLLKKIVNDAFISVAIVLMLGISLFFLHQNITSQPALSVQNELRQSRTANHASVKAMQSELNHHNFKNNRQRLATQKELTQALQDKQQIAVAHQNIYKQNWPKVYHFLLTQNKKVASNPDNNDPDVQHAIKKQNLRLQALAANKLKYEPEEAPVSGWTFTTSMLVYIVPVLYTIIAIFILTPLLTDKYYQGLDKSSLLPLSKTKKTLTELGSSFVFLTGLLIALLFIVAVIASFGNGLGSFNFPVFSYLPHTTQMAYTSVGQVAPAAFGLYLLGLLAIILTVQVVASLCQTKLATLLISLLVISGLQLLTTTLVPLQKIAQFLPTTYLYSYLIVTGEQRISFYNSHITLFMGVIILVLYSLLCFLLLAFRARNRQVAN